MDNQQESPIDSSTNKEETTDIKQIPESSSKMSSKTTSGSPQLVVVTHFISPEEFYIRYVDKNEEYLNLSRLLNNIESCQLQVDTSAGLGYMVLVPENAVFYRGTIIDEGEDTFKVQLIDKGNTIELPKTGCYELSDDLRILPKFVELCKLKSVDSIRDDWSSEDVNQFKDLLCGGPENLRIFYVKFSQCLDDYSEVELFFKNHVSVYHVLCNIIYGNEVSVPKKDTFKQDVRLRPDTFYDVVILHVNDPSSFYIGKFENGEKNYINNLKTISDELDQVKNRYQLRRLYTPSRDMPIAFLDSNENFHRAEITSIGNGKLCNKRFTILLVDVGEVKKQISWQSIYQLPDKLLEYPKQALHCRLFGVLPTADYNWSAGSVRELSNLSQSKDVIKLVVQESYTYDKIYDVVLVRKDSNDRDLCINTYLVEKRMVIGTSLYGSSSVAKYFQEAKGQNIHDNSFKDMVLANQQQGLANQQQGLVVQQQGLANQQQGLVVQQQGLANQQQGLANQQQGLANQQQGLVGQQQGPVDEQGHSSLERLIMVDIARCTSPDEIHIVNTIENRAFIALVDSLTVFYSTHYSHMATVRNFERHTLYAVRIDVDWYRAEFVDELHELEVIMLMVDISEEWIISKDLIYPLDEQFKSTLRHTTWKCHLDGIMSFDSDGSWPLFVCDRLRTEIMKFEDFYIEPKGDVVNASQPVTLWGTRIEFCTNKSYRMKVWICFNSFLIENGLALFADHEWKIVNHPFKNDEEAMRLGMCNVMLADAALLSKRSSNAMSITEFFDYSMPGPSQVNDTSYVADDETDNVDNWLPPKRLRKKRFVAKISFVTKDLELCIQDPTELETLSTVNDSLEDHYRDLVTEPPCVPNYSVDQSCVIKSVLDDKWYRARIIEVHENNATVELIDYGNSVEVDFNDIRTDLIATTKVPALYHKVKTNKIVPINGGDEWNTDVITMVRSYTIGQKFKITGKQDGDNYQAITFINSISGVELLDYLVNVEKVARYRNTDKNGKPLNLPPSNDVAN